MAGNSTLLLLVDDDRAVLKNVHPVKVYNFCMATL